MQVHDSFQEQRSEKRSSLDCTVQLNDISSAIASLQKQNGAILEEIRARKSVPRVLCHIGIQSATPQCVASRRHLTFHQQPPARKSAGVQVTPCGRPAETCDRHSPNVKAARSVPVMCISGTVTKDLPCAGSPPALGPLVTLVPSPRHGGSRRKSCQTQPDVQQPQPLDAHPQTSKTLPEGPGFDCKLAESAPLAQSSPHRLPTHKSTQKTASLEHISRGGIVYQQQPHVSSAAPQAEHRVSSKHCAAANCRSSSPPARGLQSGGRRATARVRAALVTAAHGDLPAAQVEGASPHPALPAPSDISRAPACPVAAQRQSGGARPQLHTRMTTSAVRCAPLSAQQRRSHRAVAEATRASQRLREKLGAGRRAREPPVSRPAAELRIVSPSLQRQHAPKPLDTVGLQAATATGHGGRPCLEAKGIDPEVKSISPLSLVVPRQKRGRGAAFTRAERV